VVLHRILTCHKYSPFVYKQKVCLTSHVFVIIVGLREMLNAMFRVTRRRLLVSYFMLIMIWAVAIIVMHIVIGGRFPFWFFDGHIRKLNSDQLKRLMSSLVLNEDNVTSFVDPLLQLLAPGNLFFHFFGLPKRKSHLIYGEVIFKYLL